jgi:ABC transport system ATP-binding/permease protein
MSILTAQSLAKSFGPRAILDDVSLAIDDGERLGLLGANGAGKSTLARILAGLEAPEGGLVSVRRDATIGYLAQEPALDAEKTALAEVVAGLGTWGEPHEAAAMLTRLGMGRPGARIAELSGGDRRRVALARVLVARPTLAILDEPSNHLDADTITWLEEYLAEQYPGAVLLVTHDRYLLDRVVTRTLEIERGKLYSYQGGYQEYLEARAERAGLAERTEANRQNFLRRELEWLRRQPKARTGKQKARIGRAEEARDAPRLRTEKTARLALETTRAGKSVLELRGVTLAHGERVLVRDLDLIVSPGERIGVVGPNGSGKTTLLRAILGEHAPAAGTICRGQNVAMSYFDQHRSGLDDAKSIFDNMDGQPPDVRSYLERFLFRPEDQRQPVGALSGGERARVALAKMLSWPANLVLLDEPTNDLDVAMLGSLEELLTETRASAIVVTHDRWFLDRVATVILAFEKDGHVVRYEGNYETYRALRPAPEEPVRPAKSAPPPAERRDKAQKLSFNERRELDGLLERVAAAESEVARLEAELADPTLYAARGAEVPGLRKELETARAEVARLTARWEELEARA